MTVIILIISLLNFFLLGLNFLQYMKILEISEEILEYIQAFTSASKSEQKTFDPETTNTNEEDLLIRLGQFQRMKFSNAGQLFQKREK